MDLIEIKGKVNTAICYAKVVEDEAIEQIRRMCDYPMTEGSKIRIMPDVHSGKGCTIGTTMTISDKAVPNVVGVDIGCGMYTIDLGKTDIDFEKVDEAAHFIPSGMNVWEGRQERFDLTGLACYRELKDAKRLERSLGTLGGGNHFIEIDEAEDGTKYLVIHSGSRNLGKQVAEFYQRLAINLNRGYGDYLEKRDEIIRTYKEMGRKNEIQEALKQLHWQVYESETSMPEDLCYLSGKYLEDYLHDVEICQAFARRSREKMSEIRKLMKSMGYSCKMFGKFHHDMYYKKPVLFEMHTDLFNSVEFPEAYSYYKTIGQRLIKDDHNKCGYHMTDDDFYIHIINHLYKHYSSAGTGLRSLLDVYIINKTKGQTLDRAYISREFNHLGLEDFERKVRGLSQKTFTLQPLSESDMKELSFYVNSGSYGTIDNLVISRFKQDSSIKSKRRYLLKRIFPDMRNLKVSAPVVYRHRILYPGYVVFRLVRYLAHDRSALAIELRQLKNAEQGGGNAG